MNIYFDKTNQRTFGTWPLRGKELTSALEIAIDIGYRSVDTAQMYGNEADIGASLTDLGLSRDELCITTKVHPDNFDDADFMPSVEKSLEKLRLDCVDVLLLHWPPIGEDIAPPLRLLEKAYEKGFARNIGVSNYTARMMHDAQEIIDAPLVTNQVEFHPLLNQDKLLAASSETKIPLSAYSSVAQGEVFKNPIFDEIGTGYGKTAGQIVLRWILQKGVSIITMSTKREHIRANFDVMDFTLSSVDMSRIDAITTTNRRLVDSNTVPWAPTWD